MRYAYGVAAALLIGGSAFSMTTGHATAQVAQNAGSQIVPVPGAPESFADLADKLLPAVVNINTKQRVPVRRQADPFSEFIRQFGGPQGGQEGSEERTREAGSLGSGFIISPDGYVVTNNHLIQSRDGNGTVDEVTVILTDRKEYPAKIIGRDPLSDLALLKIEGKNLPFVKWGDSDNARVGQWVVAIGNPYGLGGTVTAGIISALHRGITGRGAYDRYIQTDASINMGNSGGPMFDMAGNVIGINSALISPTGASVGIGLAIPAEAAKPVIDSLMRGRAPERGYLGVELQPVDEDLAPAFGLPKDTGEIVARVVAGTPGDKAGLVQGDVIVAIDGKPVTPRDTVSYQIANTPVGETVPITILRGDKRMALKVKVAQRPTEEELNKARGVEDEGPANEGQVSAERALGMTFQPLNPTIIRNYRLPANVRGVAISSVAANSDAADKGLKAGDVVVSVDRVPVKSSADVADLVAAAKRAGRSSVALLIQRGPGSAAYVGIEIGD